MKNKNLIITIILVIVVGAGAFYGGMRYGQTRRLGNFAQFAGGRNGNPNGQRNGTANVNFRPVSGTILSTGDSSLTVKMSDGSSKIIILSDQTVVNKTATASKTDIKQGDTVAVIGQTNSDGSVTAQTIDLNPQQIRGAGSGNGSNQPNGSGN